MANASTPLTVVGTSTLIVWPASGSLVIVRVADAIEVSAATRDDRAEQVDQLRHVIGSEIEDRSAAMLEEESRVGMPVFHAVRQHGARRRQTGTPITPASIA